MLCMYVCTYIIKRKNREALWVAGSGEGMLLSTYASTYKSSVKHSLRYTYRARMEVNNTETCVCTFIIVTAIELYVHIRTSPACIFR